jgi:hypothetical protein
MKKMEREENKLEMKKRNENKRGIFFISSYIISAERMS